MPTIYPPAYMISKIVFSFSTIPSCPTCLVSRDNRDKNGKPTYHIRVKSMYQSIVTIANDSKGFQ